MMKGLAPWLAKAVFSAIYWFGAMYVAIGLFFGDRITDNGIAEPIVLIPLWLFVVIVLCLYALCSAIWDQRINRLP